MDFRALSKALGSVDPGEWSAKVDGSLLTDDGYAYNATLYRSGRKAGVAHNGGTGGPTSFTIFDNADADALKHHAAMLPPDTTYGDPLAYDAEGFVSVMCEVAMEAKSLRRKVKTHTLIAVGDDVYAVNRRGPDVEARMLASHPTGTLLNSLLE